MQPVGGRARVEWGQKESSARSAAQAAHQQTVQLSTIGRLVIQEIEAWQRDKDPGHLLKAIDALQGVVGMSAGMAQASAGVAAEVAGAAQTGAPAWQPAAQAGGFRSSEGNIPIGGLAGAAQDAVDRAAEFAKRRVRNTIRNMENAADRAAKLLEGVAEAAKQGGAQAAYGAHGGFGGQASGMTSRPGESHGAGQGGFGGRVEGTIRR